MSWSPGSRDRRRYSTGGVYVNFLTEEEGTERLKAAYRGTNYVRLARLKGIYDPDNLFRHDQNIKPAI
jgi:FAD/FMN-containing dehydrogenase